MIMRDKCFCCHLSPTVHGHPLCIDKCDVCLFCKTHCRCTQQMSDAKNDAMSVFLRALQDIRDANPTKINKGE